MREALGAAGAIVDYARKNQVDHIVMGARSSGGLRRYLGSVLRAQEAFRLESAQEDRTGGCTQYVG